MYKLDNVVSNECSYPIDQSCANKADCHNKVCDFYNENGIRTQKLDDCGNNSPTKYDNCDIIYSYKNNGTTKTQKKSNCSEHTGICSKIEEYADDGTTVIRTKTNCDKNRNCESCEGTGCP